MSKRSIDQFFGSKTPKKQKADHDPSTTYSNHSTYPFPLPSSIPFDLSTTSKGKVINDKAKLDLLYYQPFFPCSLATQLFEFLRAEFCWYRVTYEVRGLTIDTPRYTTVFGLDDTHYFSGSNQNTILEKSTNQKPKKALNCNPRPLPGCLDQLRKSVELETGATYNFCLLNYYKDGTDSISYHSDDESFLGPNPTIASLSLGSSRDFHMRLKQDHSVTFKTTLRNGELLVMQGPTQANWDHAIPKRKGTVGGRINVTFRKAMVRYGTENYFRYNVHNGPYYKWSDENAEMVLGSSEAGQQLRKSGQNGHGEEGGVEKKGADVGLDQTVGESVRKSVENLTDERRAEHQSNGHSNPKFMKEESFDVVAEMRAIDEAVERAAAAGAAAGAAISL